MPLLIATPGVPRSAPKGSGTADGIAFARTLGIRAMEIEWVQAVPLNRENARKIRETATSLAFALTVHAPYFVNLNADNPATLAASKKRVLDALTMAEICGARSVCVHAAYYLKKSKEEAYDAVLRATEEIMKEKQRSFPSVNLAYETMGKHSQFGTLEEVLKVSKEFGIYPCIDPAHMHARENGAINTKAEWNALLDTYVEYLGRDSLKKMHLHYSGIAYTAKGERHHLPLRESDARWEDFLAMLKERKVGGVLVCESPLMEEDTLLLQRTYEAMQ